MKIDNGKYVEIVYDLYQINPDGSEELVHQVDPAQPEALIYGIVQGVVAPLEKDLEGKAEGDTFDVVATAADAFGEHNPDYIQELDKDLFNVEGGFDSELVKEGNILPMVTADGMQIFGKVLEVGPATVKMDFNHPLAGKPVRFKGSVKTVRPATEEEIIAATQGCCCGGGCSGGDCGDGCGSGCQG